MIGKFPLAAHGRQFSLSAFFACFGFVYLTDQKATLVRKLRRTFMSQALMGKNRLLDYPGRLFTAVYLQLFRIIYQILKI